MSADGLERDIDHAKQLLAAGRLTDAAASCVTLAAKLPADVRVWNLAAEVALRSKKPSEAAELLRRALICAPGDPVIMVNYARVLLRLDRQKEARVIALRVDAASLNAPDLQDALGSLLTHLEEPARALPHFQAAVGAAPNNTHFRYNLAMAQRMVGDFEAAEINLDEVIHVRPFDVEAYYARSDLRRQTRQHNHVSQMESVLGQLKGQRSAIPVAFALAKELEDLGEYRRAFAHLHEASHAYRAALRYSVAEDVAVLDKLRKTHTLATLEKLRISFGNEECIFVVGLPRSGTTLVERILGGHSTVYAAGELDAFPRVAVEAVARRGKATVSKLDFVDCALEVDFSRLGPDYLKATRPRTGHTAKFTDKLPLNYLYAGLIHTALPNARFIALHRHPMDSCYAMYRTLFAAAYPFTYDLGDLARYYVAWDRLMQHWGDVVGDAWLTVKYEDLVCNQEAVTRRMLDHCRLPWEPQCLEFNTLPEAVSTASAVQVRQPLHTDSVGRWRNYAHQLKPLVLHLEANGIEVR